MVDCVLEFEETDIKENHEELNVCSTLRYCPGRTVMMGIILLKIIWDGNFDRVTSV